MRGVVEGDDKNMVESMDVWAYMVAKHYGTSLQEAFEMDHDMFMKAAELASAAQTVESEERKKQENPKQDVIPLDFVFLDEEDD
tara:strand:+ start:287 stop:538 length:252 start_codon:yes stop_codon:yes gene_type:complete